MEKENRFIKKFQNKTTKELKSIVVSKDHVEDARQAAQWILEERDFKEVTPDQKEELPKSKASFLMQNTPERKKYYSNRMLAFGITIIVMVIYINYDALITSKNSLKQLKGTIDYCDISIEEVTSKGRFGTQNKSNKATLRFTLEEYQKLFQLRENISKSIVHPEYNRILISLKEADSVSVWINESHYQNYQPKVFQIDTDDKTVLEFQTVRSEHFGISIVLLFFGLLMALLGLRIRFPERFKKIVGF